MYLDKCASRTCPQYSTCVNQPNGNTECICQICDETYDLVCGNDLRTYASKCHLGRHVCLTKTPVTISKEEPCGMFYLFFIFFIIIDIASINVEA